MKTKQLNTDNPECLLWEYEQVKVAVLGGIKIAGLDRMRVTIKVSWKQLSIRHNLDLYNDGLLDKLIRRCAERFGLGTAYFVGVFGELINVLEAYRLAELAKLNQEKNQKKELSAEEQQLAVDFLKQLDLLQHTNELIGQSGVIGEDNNRLLMYLVFTSRKREAPLHVISLGSSGTGKSHLQEKVGELIPPEDKMELTSLSGNAFYYFGKQELRHKLLLIEDLDGVEAGLYPLRELQSKRVITKGITYKNQAGETQTVQLRVEGPICVAGCTTKESIYEDNANRSFLLYLDESQEQDNKIMSYQRRKSAGRINTAGENQVKQLLQNVQRVLQPVAIRNPFAEQLVLPGHIFKPRRTNAQYLAFIEAITFYHQYQRTERVDEDTGEVYIETTLEDIAAANQLMKEVLLRKSDDLPGACRNYLEQLTQHLEQYGIDTFTNLSISKALRIPLSTAKRHNFGLLQAGYLHRVESKGTKHFTYVLASSGDYKAIQTSIADLLDKALQAITANQQPNSLPAAQLSNGPVKTKKNKKMKASAQ